MPQSFIQSLLLCAADVATQTPPILILWFGILSVAAAKQQQRPFCNAHKPYFLYKGALTKGKQNCASKSCIL
jgi:hypothetical protein